MTRTLEGHLDAKGVRFALVVARWNEIVTSRLLAGAEDCLVRHDKVHEHLVWCHPPPATPRVRGDPFDAPRQLCKNVGVGEAPAPSQAKPNRIHPGKVDCPPGITH